MSYGGPVEGPQAFGLVNPHKLDQHLFCKFSEAFMPLA